nr:plasmid mobilization relaxosome protein MobC [uncultured Hyphomonas sp.]
MRRPGGEKTYLVFSEAAGHEAVAARVPQTRRDAPFSLRLSEEERVQLKASADGQPLGAYIKSRLFSGAQYRSRARQVDREALGKVLGALGQSRISQNLNQIAKAANIGALPVTPELVEELHETCAELKSLRQDIMAALGLRGG